MANPDDNPRVFDVSKPGKTSANATSRPIIVGHGKMIEDPMVTPASNSITEIQKDEDDLQSVMDNKTDGHHISPREAKTVAPLNETVSVEPEQQVEGPKPTSSIPEPSPEESNETEKKEPETAAEPSTTEMPPTTDTPESDPATPIEKKEQEDQISEEEKSRQAIVQKLIDEKQYVVHIGESKQRNKKLLLIIGAVAVLIVLFATYLLMSS